MLMEKTNCKNCHTKILISTAKKTNGRCMPCYQDRFLNRLISGIIITIIAPIAIIAIFFYVPFYYIARLLKKDIWKGKWISDWLTERISIKEAEEKYNFSISIENKKWERLKGKIQEGSEIWEFSSPVETWQKLA